MYLLIVAGLWTAQPSDSVLAGRLLDPSATSQPGIRITAERDTGDGFLIEAVTWTHTDGSFRLDRLPPGNYRLRARIPGPGSVPDDAVYPGGPLTVVAGDTVDGVVFVLDSPVRFEPPPPPVLRTPLATVTGRVERLAGGGPVPRVTAVLSVGPGAVVSRGLVINDLATVLDVGRHEIRFPDLPAGYTLLAATVESDTGSLDLGAGTLDIGTGTHQIVVRVAGPEAAYTIAGRVADPAASPDPALSGRIRLVAPGLMPLETRIDPDGGFRFDNVSAGVYGVRLHEAVDLSATVIDVREDRTDLVIERPPIVAVRTRAGDADQPPGPAFGIQRVLDPPSPFQETVTVTPSGTTNVIGGMYRAIARPSPSPNVPVAIRHGDLDLLAGAVELGPGSDAALDVVLGPNPALPLTGGDLEGRVVGATAGLREIHLGLDRLEPDDDGRFSIESANQGTRWVTTTPPRRGIETVPANIGITEADRTGVRVLVPPEIPVTVELDAGFPDGGEILPLPTLGIAAGGASVPAVRVGAPARLGMPPGIHPIQIVGVPPHYEVVSVTAGGTDLRAQPLVLAPDSAPPTIRVVVRTVVSGVEIRGRVTGSADVRQVHLNAVGFTPATADLDEDGGFVFPRVLPGAYTVHATPGSSADAMRIVVDEDGLDDLEVVAAPEFRVRGSVVLTDGGPLPPTNFRLRGAVTGAVAQANFGGAVRRDGSFEAWVPEGRYSFAIDSVPPGIRVTSVEAGGLDLRTAPLTVDRDTPEVRVTLATTDPPPWRRVSGSVSGLPPGATAPIEVRIDGDSGLRASAMIEPDGRFAFDRLLPGTYTVASSFAGGRHLLVEPEAPRRPATITVAGADIDDVRLVVGPTAFVQGTATVDDEAAVPRFFIGVDAEWGGSTSSTAFSPIGLDVPAGTVALDVNNFPDAFELRSLFLPSFGPRIDLLDNPEVELRAGGVYAVRARFARRVDARPVPLVGRIDGFQTDGRRAYLTFSGPDAVHVPVDDDGGFRSELAPGRYRTVLSWPPNPPDHLLLTTGIEYVTLDANVAIDSATRDLSLALPPRIEGRVETTDGSDTDRIRLRLARGAPPQSESRMVGSAFTLFASDGDTIGVDAVPFGYKVESIRYGGRDVSGRPVETGPEPETLVVVLAPLPPTGREFTIAGRIDGTWRERRSFFGRLWDGLRRVVGAERARDELVRLETQSPGTPYAEMFARIAGDGTFAFDRIRPGTYDLTLPGVPATVRVPARVVVTDTDVGGVVVRVPEWRRGTGRVTMGDGGPLPDLSGAFLATRDRWTFAVDRFRPDGSFDFTAVDDDRTRSVFGLPPGYRVQTLGTTPGTMTSDRPDSGFLSIVIDRVE